MTPKELILAWISAFNNADEIALANLYHENAINHQIANKPIIGKAAIQQMFAIEFATATLICIPENIFEDKEWGILEWKDPKGLRGCGFFQILNDKIIFQRGYWDKLSFYKLHNFQL